MRALMPPNVIYKSLSDNYVIDWHLVVREELDLHYDISVVAQHRVGKCYFV